MKILSNVLAVLLVVSASAVARADLFSFSFAGGGQNASGTLTANATGTNGGFLISSISGTLTGVTISNLLPVGAFNGNDNLLLPGSSGSYLPDNNGFSFALSNGVNANVFTFMGVPFNGQQFLLRSDGTMAVMTTFSVVDISAPEPSSWLLLGTGLAGVAGTLRRRFAGALATSRSL